MAMSGARSLLALALLLGACSVPALSLEGKQCPCVEVGYVCDTLTNRCLATNDGGGIIDTPSATQCLSSPASETELYRYAGMFDWQHADNTWSGAAEITQTSSQIQNSYTYKTSSDLTAANDYHVISSAAASRASASCYARSSTRRTRAATRATGSASCASCASRSRKAAA